MFAQKEGRVNFNTMFYYTNGILEKKIKQLGVNTDTNMFQNVKQAVLFFSNWNSEYLWHGDGQWLSGMTWY